MGRDGSQMVEGTFCYLASRDHPLADDLHLVCTRSANNLDPSAKTKCMLFPTQQICQPTTRWPTTHSILPLEDFTLADRPSNFNAGRKPLESVGSTSCSGRTLNNKKASMGLATSVYDKLAMLLKHQQWINKHLSSVNEKRRRTMFFPREKKRDTSNQSLNRSSPQRLREERCVTTLKTAV